MENMNTEQLNEHFEEKIKVVLDKAETWAWENYPGNRNDPKHKKLLANYIWAVGNEKLCAITAKFGKATGIKQDPLGNSNN